MRPETATATRRRIPPPGVLVLLVLLAALASACGEEPDREPAATAATGGTEAAIADEGDRADDAAVAATGDAAIAATAGTSAVAGTGAGTAAASDEDAPPAAIRWLSYEEGLETARQTGRPALVSFSADWCRYCRKMKSETYTDPQVIAYVERHLVPVMVDTEDRRDVAAQYFVRSLPTIWFLDSEGEKIANLPGYVDAPTFMDVLSYIATGSYKETDFRTYMESRS